MSSATDAGASQAEVTDRVITNIRREQFSTHLRQAKRVVVKVGTSTLTDSRGRANSARMRELVRQLTGLADERRSVILVTSGAIGAGMGRLKLSRRPTDIRDQQAVAAIGQGLLMHEYERLFGEYGYVIGQVLLTRDDLASRKKHLNSRNTIQALWDYGAIPIVNENDTVAIEEIRMGDNDLLAALVAGLVSADLLIILSDVDGLYDRNPREDKDAKLLSVVDEVTPQLLGGAGGPGTTFGSGGMYTKIQGAKIACASGVATVIANGSKQGIITSVVEGQPYGTLFLPKNEVMAGRKRWIAFYPEPKGRLTVDTGAARAIELGGKSLLPAGITGVVGQFDEGDVVEIVTESERTLARGLVNYGASELTKIIGHSSKKIEHILGYKYVDEVIHRDNLVLAT